LKRRHFTALALLIAALGSSAIAATPKKVPTVLVVGDSLSAEYGLKRGSGWVALLDEKLRQEKAKAELVNASISGDTTSGGRSRLPALLKQHQPAVVVIELGGNDALRGLPLGMTRTNLATMVRQAREAGAQEMPPNYGARYGQEFKDIFVSVAKAEKSALVPFFLKGVGDLADPTRLFQADRIHPNESAQPILMGNVWPELRKLLAR
jgi:acyl-CoA thioesterase I